MIDKDEIVGYTHEIFITPRYCETDQMGVVYYGHYFDWFEVARTRLFNALGLPYRRLEELSIYLPVIEAHARYMASARYDIEVKIKTVVTEFKHGMVRFEYLVTEDDRKLVKGYTRHLFIRNGKRYSMAPSDLEKLLRNDR
jgi:acyl-CoA thioester hydrolase